MIRGAVRAAVAVVLGIVFGLLLSIFLTSCGDPEEAALAGPDERAAARVVWRAELRMGWEVYPTISWRGGDAACGEDAYFERSLGYCVSGEYWSQVNEAAVVARPRISDSAYAHELVHAKQWLVDGVFDPQHTSSDWGNYYFDESTRTWVQDFSRLAEINAHLRAEGL